MTGVPHPAREESNIGPNYSTWPRRAANAASATPHSERGKSAARSREARSLGPAVVANEAAGTGPPGTGPPVGGSVEDGDPVDLATGLFVYEKTDLVVPDILPAEVKRTYRPADANSYAFGRGTTSLYDIRLWSNISGDAPQLVMPNGGVVRFQRTNPEAPTTKRYTSRLGPRAGSPGRW